MDPIKLLEFLSSQPQLLLPLLFVLLLWPIAKILVRMLETALTTDNLTRILPQTVAFVLLIHIFVGIASAVFCWAFTDLPVPMVSPDAPALLGKEVMRAHGYGIALVVT
jgi:hypothetical protein